MRCRRERERCRDTRRPVLPRTPNRRCIGRRCTRTRGADRERRTDRSRPRCIASRTCSSPRLPSWCSCREGARSCRRSRRSDDGSGPLRFPRCRRRLPCRPTLRYRRSHPRQPIPPPRQILKMPEKWAQHEGRGIRCPPVAPRCPNGAVGQRARTTSRACRSRTGGRRSRRARSAGSSRASSDRRARAPSPLPLRAS